MFFLSQSNCYRSLHDRDEAFLMLTPTPDSAQEHNPCPIPGWEIVKFIYKVTVFLAARGNQVGRSR